MDWALIETTLDDLVTGLTGVNTQWVRAPREFRYNAGVPGSALVHYLQALSVRAIGMDEAPYTFNSGADRMEVAVTGRREMTITVRTESQTATQNSSARYTAELLRTKLRLPTSTSTLRTTAGIAQVRVGEAIDISYPQSNRTVDAWAFDWILSVPSLVPTDNTDVGYFDKITIDSKIRDVEGNLLPEPPNYTDKVLP